MAVVSYAAPAASAETRVSVSGDNIADADATDSVAPDCETVHKS